MSIYEKTAPPRVRYSLLQEEDFNVLCSGPELGNTINGKEFDAVACMDEVESSLMQMVKTKAGRGQVGSM